jgi:hypothetical protein
VTQYTADQIYDYVDKYFTTPNANASIETIGAELKYLESMQEDHCKSLKGREETIFKWFTALSTLVGAVALSFLSSKATWPLDTCETRITFSILLSIGVTILVLFYRATNLVELDYIASAALFPTSTKYNPSTPDAHKIWLIKCKWACIKLNEDKLNDKAEALEKVMRIILVSWFAVVVFAAWLATQAKAPS